MFLLLMSQFIVCFLGCMKFLSMDSSTMVVFELNILKSAMVEISLPLILDWVSLSFSAVVCFISAWVMVYSSFYMAHEIYFRRFLFLVFLFVLVMNLLIFNPSMVTLMMGWDGLGVVSFLLVVFYPDSNSYSAGLITLLSNRVGDVFFIILIAMLCSDVSLQWFSSGMYMSGLSSSLGLLVLLGSITKSAQIPFSAWLPAAMAAPTPVSTLVHSSTLVTAGVYMIIRFYYLLSGGAKLMLLILSLFTFFLASVSGLKEVDVKKVVALSTLSQVSMMMMALGLGLKSLAFFHLLVHAFFKALMFMCVGVIMFFSGGSQDIRFLSKSVYKCPVSSSWFFVSVLSLCGLPFLSGFYSKDMVVELGLESSGGWFFILCVLGSVCLTAAYSFRAMLLMFKEIEVSNCGLYVEDDISLISALSGLGIMGLFGGYLLQCIFKDSLFHVEICFVWKWAILLSLGLGLAICFLLTSVNWTDFCSWLQGFSSIKRFLSKMFFLPYISGNWMGVKFLIFARQVVLIVEEFWINKILWRTVVGGSLRSQASTSRLMFSKMLNIFIFLVVIGVVGLVIVFQGLSLWDYMNS